MLLEYTCQNFKSIGDNISFSMVAGSDNSLIDNIYNYKDISILKEAIIYGANGSGKSNVIDSLSFFKQMVCQSHTHIPGSLIRTFQNKKKMDDNTEYQIQFINNGVRYLYGFSYNSHKIEEEFLYYFPNEREAKIFERKEAGITYGDKFKKELSGIQKDYLKDNRLFLSCAAQYRNVKEIMDAFLFFSNKLVVFAGQPEWHMYSTDVVNKNEKLKKIFLTFMNEVCSKPIIDIDSKIESKVLQSNEIPPFFNDDIQSTLKNQPIQIASVKLMYDNFVLDLNEESQGIQKLFELFFPFVDIIVNEKIFICDELETHLHPLIVKELIKLFKGNSKKSQMIFTTHDVNLLDLSLYRRDQIWFTEIKSESLFTDLYSLSELKAVRKDENIVKNYILGKYSGIPMINNEIKNTLLQSIIKDE